MFPHMVAAPAQPALPDLPAPDEALITRLFESDSIHSLQDLFNSLKSAPIEGAPSTLLNLLRWSERPDIKPWLTFYEAQQTASLKRKHLANLDKLALESENPIERRRASTTILRHLGLGAQRRSPSSPPGGGAALRRGGGSISTAFSTQHPRFDTSPSPAEANPLDSSPLTVSPCHRVTASSPPPLTIPQAYAPKEGDQPFPQTPVPDPLRTPEDVIAIALQAIQNPDHPERDTGPFTLFNIAGHIKDRTPAYFARFRGNYLKNMVHDAWNFAIHDQRWFKTYDNRIYARIDLTLRNGQKRYMKVKLERPTSGTLKDCWLLRHFIISSEYKPSPDPDDPFHDSS